MAGPSSEVSAAGPPTVSASDSEQRRMRLETGIKDTFVGHDARVSRTAIAAYMGVFEKMRPGMVEELEERNQSDQVRTRKRRTPQWMLLR